MDRTKKMNFSDLVFGFSSAALSYLGFGQEAGGSASKNLALAKQNIDILELLEEKTKGNLSAEEKLLLEHVLADLRLKFVEASK